MNQNNIYNQNEVKNKLQNFQEGKDYFVTPSQQPEIKDYTFFNERLKSLFGGNNWIPVRVWQEKYEDENVKYRGHFEEGKDYRYSAQHWDYGKSYQGDRGIEDMPDWMRPIFADRKEGIAKHSKIEVVGESGNIHSGEKYWEGRWTYQGKKNEYEYGLKVEAPEKSPEPKLIDNNDDKSMNCCECGRNFHLSEVYWYDKGLRGKFALCSSECKERFIEQERKVKKDEHLVDNYHGEWKAGDEPEKTKKPELEKENSELRQQLASVQAELAKILAELKKLTVKSEALNKLEQQQVRNEKVMKEGSVAEIKEQVSKSQALVQATSTNTIPLKSVQKEPKNNLLPYVAVGSLLVVSVGAAVVVGLKKRGKK